MIFLSLIAVLAIVHWTNVAGEFQRDGWFIWLVKRMQSLPAASRVPLLPMLLSFMIPLLVLIFCVVGIVYFLSFRFLFFLYVPVLLYSLGRGNFLAEVNHYIALAARGDTVAAANWVDDMAGHISAEIKTSAANDWKTLHTQALKVISYRGFERTFAVLFWFVIAGALGALLYRLSSIYRELTTPGSAQAELAERWLWLIEMPAVRLMGLTWAFVGNFDSCPWRDSLLDTQSSSVTILNNNLRGALSAPTDAYLKPDVEIVETTDIVSTGEVVLEVNTITETPGVSENKATSEDISAEASAEEVLEDLVGAPTSPNVEPAYSFALVKSSVPLYSRSLLFWIGAIAFATLFI